ncbi:amidohydrolase family protein, partial [bacterium]|nr:amidohydrolase family protein [bacterium]
MPLERLLLFSVLLTGCTKTAVQESPLKWPTRIIDAHVHFDDDDGASILTGRSDLLQELVKNGVTGAVVHANMTGPKPKKLPDDLVRFSVCAAIVPNHRTPAQVEEGIKDGTYHCMKIYLGYVPLWPSAKFYQPFYKLAERTGVPVVFHTGDTVNRAAKVKFADPLRVDEVAVKYPKVTFVLAHMGNPWIASAAEVVYKNENVYADTSALVIEEQLASSPEVLEELVTKPI